MAAPSDSGGYWTGRPLVEVLSHLVIALALLAGYMTLTLAGHNGDILIGLLGGQALGFGVTKLTNGQPQTGAEGPEGPTGSAGTTGGRGAAGERGKTGPRGAAGRKR